MSPKHAIASVGSLLLALALCVLLAVPALAQSLSTEELIKNSRLYDGKTVSFAGEVIGDVMVRGGYAWVNLSDGSGGLGVWMPSELAGAIQNSGSYKASGDWVEVSGVFNRNCPQHGGDLDIHAQSIRKLNSGSRIMERLNLGKRNLALVLAVALCLVMILSLLQKK